MPEPAPWAPAGASPEARRLWMAPLTEKWEMLTNPSEENARVFIRAGIESFNTSMLQYAINSGADIIPQVRQSLRLDDDWIRPWAQLAVRLWWRQILAAASNVPRILEDIRRHDPQKGAILSTPDGRRFLDTTIYNLLTFFRWYGGIKGNATIAPPPKLHERLIRRALAAPGRILYRIRTPHPDAMDERAPSGPTRRS